MDTHILIERDANDGHGSSRNVSNQCDGSECARGVHFIRIDNVLVYQVRLIYDRLEKQMDSPGNL